MFNRELYKDYLRDTQELNRNQCIFVAAIRILKEAADYMEIADKMYEISGRRFGYRAVDHYAWLSKRDYRFPCHLSHGDCTGRNKRKEGALKTFICEERHEPIQDPIRLLKGLLEDGKYSLSRDETKARVCADAARNCAIPSSVVRSLQRIAILTASAAAEHKWVVEELKAHGL